MSKHKILIMGGGKIGITVAGLLTRTGDYISYIGDINPPHSLPTPYQNLINFHKLNIENPTEIIDFIRTNQIGGIVSCLPYNLTIEVAKIAHTCGINYFDPTEDVETTTAVNELAKNSKGNFAPQCGLAPGFISIAANSLMSGFEDIDYVKMRVGALTQNTSNSLNYAFTWSVDGVVNEYIRPCLVIENGERKLKPALADLETIIVDNFHYEAFNTSGGAGSLVDSYAGKVKNMNYKTMRYPGHCNKMSFILNDLRLKETPELAKSILSKVIPHSQDDKVVVCVAVQGNKNGMLTEKTYTNTLFPMTVDGNTYTAIQMTTATAICTIIDLVMHEKKLSGLIKQEEVSLDEFLSNRFGAYYAQSGRA
ncbi:MAG: saccharopine dehydrogenase NADP-binding domain-containing protein [Burkholderiales bacterium]|nr:saccharopine dehydrogenase NADP-binding domain-containing protein [Burkholderiales bacterium]